MIYIDKDYLISHAQERFIDESSQNDDEILDQIELTQIAIIKTYLGTRYDVNTIFAEDSPIDNEVLKEILAKLVLYKLIRRNAARKVPNDYKEQFDEAMKTLKEVATGIIRLDGVPSAVASNGSVVSNSISGNLSNSNFYI
ncbi:phage protein Gp36 family protein [Flavobacterium sp.]|jgi:phage gp36-like protein|uniref:phage protein Gp36 family protein n=1 Tax=Flavobacterium sp. TaxID=239 RepID=UPI0037C064B1